MTKSTNTFKSWLTYICSCLGLDIPNFRICMCISSQTHLLLIRNIYATIWCNDHANHIHTMKRQSEQLAVICECCFYFLFERFGVFVPFYWWSAQWMCILHREDVKLWKYVFFRTKTLAWWSGKNGVKLILCLLLLQIIPLSEYLYNKIYTYKMH